ncbi:hypothetical protein MNBD_ALPHA02-1092 [hydrothermal vent metagenome]|uniref:SsuA/THI5-like domain-containing protein n=1 Tax=hydrothermal vent metagenome TaxID=652676 RepID=A0A3B0R2V5_9ZZZZ
MASELLSSPVSLLQAGEPTGKPLVPVRIFSFPGLLNLLIWAGQEKKFFQAEGLEVSHALTRTSMELVKKLSGGQYDIATSSIDNVIAYNSGQGQVALPRKADFFGFMNINKNMTLSLIVQPGIRGFEDLKGKSFAVDAISTGFSFVLRKILERHGLGVGDYELVSVGNAAKRLESLKQGLYAGAILTPPFNQLAEASGLQKLGSSQDITDNYQGTCFISTRRWAAKNPQCLMRFIRAILAVENWLSSPSHHNEAAQILRRHNNAMTEAGALNAVKGLVRGLSPDFNQAGIDTVLVLRGQYGNKAKPLGQASDYIDMSYLENVRTAG